MASTRVTPHRAAPRSLVVDGANVVGSRPDGWWRDRPGAARRLGERLSAWAAEAGVAEAGVAEAGVAEAGAADEVVLVLEGKARSGLPVGTGSGVRVVHAAGEGDDEIVAQTAAAPGPVTVVTADRGLRSRVERLGAQTVGPSWLWDRLDAGGGSASADPARLGFETMPGEP